MKKTVLQRRIRMEQKNSETEEDLYDLDLKIIEADDQPEEQAAMSGCPKGYCKLKNTL